MRARFAAFPTSPEDRAHPIDEQEALEDAVHRVHDRYLVEVVEELGICPFARKSRELRRVLRPLVFVHDAPPTPTVLARELAEAIARHPQVEIVLLTFLGGGALGDPQRFEACVEPLRKAYAATGAPHFFMVAFHPRYDSPRYDSEEARPPTKDSLVPLLRRSPDPVVQCVRADMLEQVRQQAQASAHARRLAEVETSDPVLKALLQNSIQTDCELSSDIARRNFESCGHGEGRMRLEARVASILADRDRSYGHRFCG